MSTVPYTQPLETYEVLDKAIDVIKAYGWIKGDLGDKHRGFCATGAIQEAAQGSGVASKKVIWAVENYLNTKGINKSLVGYNDNPYRNRDEVINVLKDAADALRPAPAESVIVVGNVITWGSKTTNYRVTAVGETYFLAILVQCSSSIDGDERRLPIDGHSYELYVEPVVFPERWANVYETFLGADHPSRAEADRANVGGSKRLGVIHIKADGTVEMEKP